MNEKDAVVVPSELIVKASQSLKSLIEDELLVDDPHQEKANASLKENEIQST